MKIFISWSGDASHEAARALKEWLPNVFQAIAADDVFLSSEDIAKGSVWFAELGKILDQSAFGILCLTPANLTAPWILFEAGALAKHLSSVRVVPLLIGVDTSTVTGPLSQLNSAGITRDEIRKLAKAINKQLGNHALDEQRLAKAFAHWWPDLRARLQKALAATMAAPAFDIFLSTPMAGFETDRAYRTQRAAFKKVFDTLRDECKLRVYWAAEKIESMKDFDAVDVSVADDIAALDASRYFVLVYPKKIATSALFEAGYAFARGKPARFFVPKFDMLPFLMRKLRSLKPGVDVNIHTRDEWEDYDDLQAKLRKNAAKWFPVERPAGARRVRRRSGA